MVFNFTATNSLVFLSIFILGLFPGSFVWLLGLPLYPIKAALYSPAPSPPPLPVTTCACTASNCPTVAAHTNDMAWVRKHITLSARSRGAYLVTDEVLKQIPEIKQYKIGLLHLHVKHTSCALSLNENWDSDVRSDMSNALDRIVPEDRKGTGLYAHDAEGSDDMPAHIKSTLVGASVSVPIEDGRLETGTWQGIWFLEFRDAKQSRKVVATLQGEKK